MAHDQPGVTPWLELIQAEYREMPGLSLNKVQMQRLWGLDGSVCDDERTRESLLTERAVALGQKKRFYSTS